MFSIQVNSFSQWREQARELLLRQVSPDDIVWEQNEQQALFKNGSNDFMNLPKRRSSITISREFIEIAKSVACHRNPARWPLLYSVAWRLLFENRDFLGDTLDPQVTTLLSMRKSVSRDIHKMEAFVRFRKMRCFDEPISSSSVLDEKEYFVAWFEPEHHIVRHTARFFVKRFNNMSWSILTPDICVHWDMESLNYSDGLACAPRIEDDLEVLWRQYYTSIFNPARLKLKAMQSEMPKKYWKNLPEASLINELSRSSSSRVETMLKNTKTQSCSKVANARYIKEKQAQLRSVKK